MRNAIRVVPLALAGLLTATAANAIVIYEFAGAGFGGAAHYSFVYNSPDFISGFREVTPSDLAECLVEVSFTTGESCGMVRFDASAGTVEPWFLRGTGSFGGATLFHFAPSAFTLAGEYTSVSGYFATLRVSEVAMPEPGSLALVGLGLVGLGFARRRKLS